MPEPTPQWVVENLNDTVDSEFDVLPKDIQAKFLHLAALVEELGLLALKEPYVKHLQGKGSCESKRSPALGAASTAP